jgi:hypothetical protein
MLAIRPVALGRTRSGVLAAAVMLATWQLATPAAAQVANPGYSENEYFRLDWYYDLPNVWGEFTITKKHWPETFAVSLDEFTFRTFGMRFDYIRMNGGSSPFRRNQVGPDYEYSLGYSDRVRVANEVEFEVWYPRVDVGVADTSVDYGGVASSVLGPLVIPSSSMDFVTVQAIPAPAGAATLLLGAAALLTRRRDA